MILVCHCMQLFDRLATVIVGLNLSLSVRIRRPTRSPAIAQTGRVTYLLSTSLAYRHTVAQYARGNNARLLITHSHGSARVRVTRATTKVNGEAQNLTPTMHAQTQ